MPNFATQLKSEIQRLARKEIRAEISSLRKSATAHREEIVALKRRVSILEKTVKNLSASLPARDTALEEGHLLRWRATGFASLRKRLDLSAGDMGKLLDVTGATIHSWETGKTKPRTSQLVAIARVRRLGKRAAAAMLATVK